MPNSKKFLDATGLTYFAGKLDNYPTNELLSTVINAIDGEITELQSYHLTREQIEDIIEDLYPEATAEEVEDMVDEVLEDLSTAAEDMIEEILSEDSSGGENNSYAPLASPYFTGVPTAPTAAYGTNTTQIATTAFVQNAIKPVILVTTQDIPNNVTVIMTLTDQNSSYSISQELNSSGITTIIPNLLTSYNISFNHNEMSIYSSTLTINALTTYSLNTYWINEAVTYTVNIDKTNNNPSSCCTYADDAENMIKGSSNWDTQPIFKDIKPCVFKNGQVQYYLNPDDWNEKADGTTSNLTGGDGDVMIEFPKFAYKIKTNNNIISVSISNDPNVIRNDNDYTYDAFSRLEEGDLNYFYKGAFKGSLDGNGKLRSIAGVLPVKDTTITGMRAAAQANGAHYQQSTYAQLKALQCLYLIKYGSLDGQTALGPGNTISNNGFCITGYNVTAPASITSERSVLASGMCFGDRYRMRLFGIEDFWGNIWEWVDGVESDSSLNVITSWSSFSGETGATNSSVTTPSGLSTAITSGCTKDVIGNTAAGFLTIDKSGSTSTYYTDAGRLNSNCILNFGGRWTTGNDAGPFIVNLNNSVTKQDANTGARLSYV